jgi:hypothetical protein
MTERHYPYRVMRRSPTLSVSQVRLDGHRPDVDVLAAHGQVNLAGLDWARLSIRADLELPSGELRDLGVDDPSAVLILHCQATNLRIGAELLPSGRPGVWSGTIDVGRDFLARRAQLSAVVVGAVDGEQNRYLGSPPVLNVWIDEPEVPLLRNTLPVRWAKFADPESPASSAVPIEFRDQPYYVNLVSNPPVIWLNDVPWLRGLLGEGRVSREAAVVRTGYYSAIATGGWVAIFNAAAAGIRRNEGEDPEWPIVQWQEQVLRTLLPLIYPDVSVDTALTKVAEDIADPLASRDIQGRVQAAIARNLRMGDKTRKAVRALELPLVDMSASQEI